MNPKVSVIIPAGPGEEEYITKTLFSLQHQITGCPEIIVVANGEALKERTPQLAEDLGAKVLELSEGSVSKARNYGAERSSGEILVFNDADTLVAPNYLTEVSKVIGLGKDFGSARLKPESTNLFSGIVCWQLNIVSRLSHYFHGNSFMTRNIFAESEGYNEKLNAGEDTDLAERMKMLGEFTFLDRTYIVPSERKMREEGYFKSFLKFNQDNFLWLLNRKGWNRKHYLA